MVSFGSSWRWAEVKLLIKEKSWENLAKFLLAAEKTVLYTIPKAITELLRLSSQIGSHGKY